MPRIEISKNKGLIQKSGSSCIGHVSENNDGYGIYRYVREIDFAGVSMTATDNGLIKTICTLPDNAHVTRFDVLCTEAFSDNNTRSVDFGTTASASAADAAITVSTAFLTSFSCASGGSGAKDTLVQTAHAGNTKDLIAQVTEQKVVMFNDSTSNNTTELTSGKLMFIIEYIGSAAATDLTTV